MNARSLSALSAGEVVGGGGCGSPSTAPILLSVKKRKAFSSHLASKRINISDASQKLDLCNSMGLFFKKKPNYEKQRTRVFNNRGLRSLTVLLSSKK